MLSLKRPLTALTVWMSLCAPWAGVQAASEWLLDTHAQTGPSFTTSPFLAASSPGFQMLPLLAQAASPGPQDAAAAAAAPAGRAAQCASQFGMPWGPIGGCSEAIVVGVASTAMVAGFLGWWSDGFNNKFSFRNEGWFGPDTYSGGIDKLGHAFSMYVTTRLLNRAFTWAGDSDSTSLWRATLLSAAIGLGIEVFDGLEQSGKYGFSWQDLIMDAAGIGLAFYAERNPEFDKWFAFRWRREMQTSGTGTYESHQYFGVLRLSGWSQLGVYNPLRYVELMAGYGAAGFRGDSSGITNADNRKRTIYAGIGLNLTELLDRTVFSGNIGGGRTQWFATEFLRYVQLPGTASTHPARTWTP